MKNQIFIAFIVVGAIIIAIPVFIFGVIRLVWDVAISLAAPRAPIAAKKIRQVAAAAEAHISGRQINK
jgi:hypothetical protein